MFYHFVSLITRLLVWIFGGIDVEGQENVPRKGPFLLVANHVNFADPGIIGAYLTRKAHYMAKIELFKNPFMALFIRLYESFSVRRGEGDAQAVKRSIAIIKAGKVMGMFPEGHRSVDGKLAAGMPGAALIAARSDTMIVPVGIAGTLGFLQPRNLLKRQRIRLRIGKPFSPKETLYLARNAKSSRGRQAILSEEIMYRIAELLPEEQRGVYAHRLPGGPAESALESASRDPDQISDPVE